MTADRIFALALLVIALSIVWAWLAERRQPHPREIITKRPIVSDDAAALDMLDAMAGKDCK